ncbi:histidine kinase dimerization/phospho-acceptor domain-containing protein, partial [Salmonella enterica]|uniref:histidine kinase dimerization/phospho-acceptor domain-containing protein n=1 Tax=Salmonella enterica TaxID=28901 RepID=UPI003D2ACEF9
PLNGVLGFAELLLDGELNSEQRQKAVLLLDASKSLLAIIGDILDISKVEAGKLDLEHVPFGIKNVVDSAAAISGAQINAKLLTIETEFAP